MKIKFADLNSLHAPLKREIQEIFTNSLEESRFIGGNEIHNFESHFRSIQQSKYFSSAGNGTDTLFAILQYLKIGKSDEVITPAHSWISSAEVINLVGATPVFVDTEEDYFTIDPKKVEEKISKSTKAIIGVHLFGGVFDIDRLLHISTNYNIPLIEDCAQAHFSTYNGVNVGNFGIAGSFSFFPGKNLGAFGDAGGISTNSEDLDNFVRRFNNHGAFVKHNHEMIGLNSRLDTINAAVLDLKMNYILEWNSDRARIANRYIKLLSDIEEINTPVIRDNSKHTFHLFVIRVDRQIRNKLIQYLNLNEIETSLHYPTIIPLQKAYTYLGLNKSDFPVSYKHSQEMISLPIHPKMKTAEVDYVCDSLRKFFNR